MPRKSKPSPRDEDSFRGDRTQTEEDSVTTDAAGHDQPEQATHYEATNQSTQRAERPHTMSMIDPTEWNLDDSQEPYALKDGAEVILRIIEVRKQERQDTGSEFYVVRFEVPDDPYSKDIVEFFDVPSSKLDAKRLNAARQKMQKFAQAFGLDMTRPVNPAEDWVGAEGWCILSLSKSAQYGEQNRISTFVRSR